MRRNGKDDIVNSRKWGFSAPFANIAAISIFLSFVFYSLYHFNLSTLKPLYVYYDMVGMDSLPFLDTLQHNDWVLPLHPFSKTLSHIPYLMNSLFSISPDQTISAELAFLGSLNIVLCFLILFLYLRNIAGAFLFSVAYGLLFSNLVFFSMPETYMVSDFLVLVYMLFLMIFRNKITRGRFLLLSALAGLAASNNLPLLSLLVPHTFLAWEQQRNKANVLFLLFMGCIISFTVFSAVAVIYNDGDYWRTLMQYNHNFGSPAHFFSLSNWYRVIMTFFFTSVISPVKSLCSNIYDFKAYFLRPEKIVLLTVYAGCVFYAGYLNILADKYYKKLDPVFTGCVLWLLPMTLAYVYWSPQESFVFCSQVLIAVVIFLTTMFEKFQWRYKYSLAAIIILLLGYNNLSTLYHPCTLTDLWPRTPVMGYSLYGRQIKAAQLESGFTTQLLAERIGVSSQLLTAFERGETEIDFSYNAALIILNSNRNKQVDDADRSRCLRWFQSKPVMSFKKVARYGTHETENHSCP